MVCGLNNEEGAKPNNCLNVLLICGKSEKPAACAASVSVADLLNSSMAFRIRHQTIKRLIGIPTSCLKRCVKRLGDRNTLEDKNFKSMALPRREAIMSITSLTRLSALRIEGGGLFGLPRFC